MTRLLILALAVMFLASCWSGRYLNPALDAPVAYDDPKAPVTCYVEKGLFFPLWGSASVYCVPMVKDKP